MTMSKETVETIYGKHHKYEIIQDSGLMSTKYYVYRDGEYYKGYYDSLAKAVAAARDAG